MSNGDSYYVGHPVTYTPPVPVPAPAPAPGPIQAPQVAAGGEPIPVTVTTQTPGATQNYSYFVGHPLSPEKTLQPAQPAPPPPPAQKKRSSFLAICFPCIGGSRVAEQ